MWCLATGAVRGAASRGAASRRRRSARVAAAALGSRRSAGAFRAAPTPCRLHACAAPLAAPIRAVARRSHSLASIPLLEQRGAPRRAAPDEADATLDSELEAVTAAVEARWRAAWALFGASCVGQRLSLLFAVQRAPHRPSAWRTRS